KASDGQLGRALAAGGFEGKAKTSLDVLALPKSSAERIIVVGLGDVDEMSRTDWMMVGGYVAGMLASRKVKAATLIADLASGDGDADQIAADLALGAQLRRYTFTKYRAEAKNDEKRADVLERLTILVKDVSDAEEAFAEAEAIGQGMMLARDLVNEPANALGPVEFAKRCAGLSDIGVDVEIFDADQLEDMKFHSLLAVAQGSARPARVAVMQWNGAKSKRAKPVCFIGKGVVFDTGGISMKPAGGMEDMKGDMGGAACVTGLMHALAARKANVNAVGLVGLVENMPSDRAMRPGDIIQSRSGKTIEVLNTDAEGRLVLADLLWYAEETYNPKFMVNLATLTGAIIVALGKEHAGLFSNDDTLAGRLAAAGEATGEKVWRMPLDKAYDKLLNTPNADMKNIGGRNAGAITAAQFLQRFVTDTPWAHLDVAGTAMASTKTDISQSWASGWGVRLLNEVVANHYES
ncbi:MAG: leucyl aminopeptidase, partial [Pseudomonadota bacterium]